MQGYGRTLITNAGSKMLTDVDGAKGKITYTKAVLYAQDIKGMSEDEQRALTTIDDEQMSTPVIVTDIKEETVTVSASFNNAKLTKDIAFNSIGWFAKTSVDDQERLLAVTPSDAEQTIVAGSSGASTSALDINMAFARNDNATVVIKPTEAGLINQAQLDAATNQVKVNLEAEITTQVDNINKQIKTLGKVKKVQGKEPDAEGNVDITFGKIIKGWDMSNNTYDPSQTKNNDSISNIWPVDQMVIAQVVSKLLSTETSLKSEIAKKDNTTDVNNKLSNIRSTIHTIANPILEDNKTNPNSLTEPGIYFSKNGFNFAKNDIPDGYRSDGKTYIFVLEGENPGYSLNYYQQFMFQATKFNFECWYRAGYKYGSDAYYTVSFDNLKDIFGKFKQISLNGGTAISPDEDGVAKLNVVTKVDNTSPDSNGNVNTDHYTKAESDKRHNDLISRIQIQENKEIVHQCDDLDSGIAYSKAHPNVFVATP